MSKTPDRRRLSLLERFHRRAEALRRKPMGRDLRSIRAALGRLGDPQDAVPSVLIGGTNGKGSTAAMVESAARAAGLHTGLFHSPAPEAHEHVLVNGSPVDRSSFADRFLRADAAGDLTWFEAITAAAFLTFAEEPLDLAVVEVGLGGARDCTNGIASPVVSALVTVDLDHQHFLGTSLVEIAREKSGIFRRGRAAVIGRLAPEAEAEAIREAERVGARPVLCRRRRPRLETRSVGDGQEVRLFDDEPPVRLALAGEHQARNAALAALVVEELGLEAIDRAALVRGLERCRRPGRMEWIRGLSRPVLLDAAHNPAAAQALAAYLSSAHLASVELVFGAFEDKDAAGMFQALGPRVNRPRLTTSEHPRSASPERLAEAWARVGSGVEPILHSSLHRALDEALGSDSDHPLCVTGSADLVDKARRILLPRGRP